MMAIQKASAYFASNDWVWGKIEEGMMIEIGNTADWLKALYQYPEAEEFDDLPKEVQLYLQRIVFFSTYRENDMQNRGMWPESRFKRAAVDVILGIIENSIQQTTNNKDEFDAKENISTDIGLISNAIYEEDDIALKKLLSPYGMSVQDVLNIWLDVMNCISRKFFGLDARQTKYGVE